MKPTLIALALLTCLFSCNSRHNTSATTPPKKNDPAIAANDTGLLELPWLARSAGGLYLADQVIAVPPYGLEKIKLLVSRVPHDPKRDDYGSTDSLSQRMYKSLSFREKFTYNMIHPDSYSQICHLGPFQTDHAHRIFGTLPDVFGEYDWSSRQLAFFNDHRDSVIALMKDLIKKEGRVGENFKQVIIVLNATELIPLLTDAARKETKDHNNLTVLILLMKENDYPEYINSSFDQKLKGEPIDGRPPFLVYNKANEDLIIQQANNFYQGLRAK